MSNSKLSLIVGSNFPWLSNSSLREVTACINGTEYQPVLEFSVARASLPFEDIMIDGPEIEAVCLKLKRNQGSNCKSVNHRSWLKYPSLSDGFRSFSANIST